MKEFIFYYDVICPYAYLASRLVEDVAQRAGALIKWRPVLLGGIYKATKASTENASSIKSGMCDAKRAIVFKDLMRSYLRHQMPCNPSFGMQSDNSLHAMRLLAGTFADNSEQRVKLTHVLFKSLWDQQQDIGEPNVLQKVVNENGFNLQVHKIIDDAKVKRILIDNTTEAVNRGAFGVPSFLVNDRLFFGSDRLHFLEWELTNKRVEATRLLEKPKSGVKHKKLTIFHDVASPWSFIGSKQIKNLVDKVAPVEVEVEWVPILLGGLLHAIGTPQAPLLLAGENKRSYGIKDVLDTCRFHNINFQFPDQFPFMSVNAQRMLIVQPDARLREALYDAAWIQNRNLEDKMVLKDILKENGYNAELTLEKINSSTVKAQLRSNTERAFSAGLCGLPSYQVDGGSVIWGQDRLNVVADMLCGYPDDIAVLEKTAKL